MRIRIDSVFDAFIHFRVMAVLVAYGLCCVLEMVDNLVSIPLKIFTSIFGWLRPSQDRKALPHVVIIGGSFSGLWCTRFLEDKFRITLVDAKDFWEYTPGVLRLLVDEAHVRNITAPALHPHSKASFVHGKLVGLSPSDQTVQVVTTTGKEEVIYSSLLQKNLLVSASVNAAISP